jgi:hypothetical protein
MGPFRTADVVAPDLLPQKQPPPEVVGFGMDAEFYTLFTLQSGAVTRWTVPSVSSERAPTVETLPFVLDSTVQTLVHERAWLMTDPGGVYGVVAPGQEVMHVREGVKSGNGSALWMDGELRLLLVQSGRVSVCTADQKHVLLGPVHRADTSRKLLAAVSTVHGPVAIFSTDRDDEIDLCALRSGSVQHRTVSLGHGQSFVCAAAGATRIAVVSRRNDDVRVRTIASDLRSELNPVPLATKAKAVVGTVKVAHAGGSAFALVHQETSQTAEIVTTVFEDGKTRTLRTKALSLQGLGVCGKQLAVAALQPGCIVPILYVQQVQLVRDEARGETSPAMPRRRAYLLGSPPASTAQARRALLVDAAEVLSQSLSAQNPRELLVAQDQDGASESVAAFMVPGADAAHDVALAILLRADGSAIVTAKLGDAKAPAPRPLTLMERIRVFATGDDDADPRTVRTELRSLCRQLGDVVMAIWTLRLVQ